MTHPTGKQARKSVLFFLLLLLGLLPGVHGEPTGAEILGKARQLVRSQDLAMTGQIRTGSDRVPFRLEQKSGITRFIFTEPEEIVTVEMTGDAAKIRGVKDVRARVRNSLLTYEDLTLHFLFWNDVQDRGVEKIRGLPCWKIRVATADRSSAVAVVLLWVNRQSGAMIRAQTFDWQGTFVKQFDVISTQTVDGLYFLKQMKVQLQKKGAPNEETLSYLEMDRPQR